MLPYPPPTMQLLAAGAALHGPWGEQHHRAQYFKIPP